MIVLLSDIRNLWREMNLEGKVMSLGLDMFSLGYLNVYV